MAIPPSREGTISFTVPSLDVPCLTYYKIVGNLSPDRVPVVMLHGGPGAGHGILNRFAKLWVQYGIPVIFYDQIGCGLSTHLRHTAGDEDFWHEDLFIAELNNLLDHFHLREHETGFHLFGFSWGAMLAAAFAATRPSGLHRLVLASGVASKELSLQSVNRWKAQSSVAAQHAIDNAVKNEDFTSPSYRDAMVEIRKLMLCRTEPAPHELVQVMKNQHDDNTVNRTM